MVESNDDSNGSNQQAIDPASAAAAHRGRWLIDVLADAVKRLEDPGTDDDARKQSIDDVTRTWQAVAAGPYKGDKFLREVLIQALEGAAAVELGVADFIARLETTHPEHAAQLKQEAESVATWIDCFRRNHEKWKAVNEAAQRLGATRVSEDTIR